MYTAADIRNVEFSKNMGGYKIAEVDAFRDACADTVQALTAEKEELSKKMSILADKLVEYRRDEDAIRSALLRAERMGDEVVREAQKQAEKMLADARYQADNALELAKKNTEEYIASSKETIAFYEAELARAKKEVSDFKTNMLILYKEHLALLKSIPEVRAEAPADNATPAEVAPATSEKAPAAAENTAEEENKEKPAPVAPAPVDNKPAASRFSNLKFGEDYDVSEDEDDE